MKNQLLISVLVFITFFTCNKLENSVEINSFLQANYEFNNRILNKYRGNYYKIISEQPRRSVERLNQLDKKFKLLILKIDSLIANKENDLKRINSESNEVFDEIEIIVDNRKDYFLPKYTTKKTNSNELNLKYIKNKLVIAMAYAFEYNSESMTPDCSINILKVDSIFSEPYKNGITLTLTSKHGQNLKENRHVLINKIEVNGEEKKIDYQLKDNYSFTDIQFDSLQKGKYVINGVLRFYERSGQIDIPFKKEFKLE